MSVFVLWAPARPKWSEMYLRLTEQGGVHDVVTIVLKPEAFGSLVHDLYPDADRGYIDQKVDRLLAGGDPILRVIECDCSDPVARKAELREIAATDDPFLGCHASSSPAEELYMSEVLLTLDNMWYVRRRRSRLPSPTFLARLGALRYELARLGLDRRDICIVGGAVLEAGGLRECTDIDFTVLKQDRDDQFGPGVTEVAPGIDIVTEGYHRLPPDFPSRVFPFTDDDLIRVPTAHFHLLGFKFASFWVVLERKRHDRRPKDLVDVELIRDELGADERLDHPRRYLYR